ncbi:MAG: hypothetical protein K2N31_01365 [Treponemataceae bacterium]|nr:hypothetical protein [Treponemataceae bacterium]
MDDDGTLVGYHGDGAVVTAIGGGAVDGHAEIAGVSIPKSVTDIGAGAFRGSRT